MGTSFHVNSRIRNHDLYYVKIRKCKMTPSILITGGAGLISSHIVERNIWRAINDPVGRGIGENGWLGKKSRLAQEQRFQKY